MFTLYKKYLKKYKVQVFLGPLFKLFEAVFELLVPLIIRNMINEGVNGTLTGDEKIRYILFNGGLLILFTFIGLCTTIVCQFFASRASQGFGTALRNDLFKHINTLSFKEIDNFSTSSLLTRLNSDINNVQQSVAMLIRLVIRAPFLIIGATILSFNVNFYAGLIFLFAGILLFAIIFLIMIIQVKKNRIQQQKMDTITNITKENISGNRVVRAFNRQKYEFERFVDENVSLKNVQVRIGRLNALLNPLVFITTNAAIILVLYVCGIAFKNGTILQGDVTALYNYLLQIQIAVMVVANLVVVFTKAKASSARINEVFNTESSIVSGCETTKLNNTPLVLKNVSFRYNKDSLDALHDISVEIKEGMTLGIIGGTGSGKTTFSSLINRFYDIDSGEILLFGRNIKDYDLSFVRSEISQVFQKSVLFKGTLRHNLKLAKKDATDKELLKALEIAQAKEFVDHLDNGLDTIIYQGGKNLSGGQRQRLSIARAIVKDSDILVLDDTKSALDFRTSKLLTASLKSINKTIIEISQRASDMAHCDLVMVLDKGCCVGLGTHEELIETCDVYKEICESQDVRRGE
ncbi:MAG: ABC transporter ATP-binding protein/permease [Acholeplasmatales bacterium]|nr:ABC transporter ATP-binding protein/permease [Acholeplasmatales bacterium]